MYKKGLLSVVIPTYKRSGMLTRAIDSVLSQTYADVECIVVNDNTPGDEWSLLLYEMIDKYAYDKRLRFVEQEVHKNGAAARNAGIKVAKGEYIAFLDDDDYWDAEKAEIQIPVLRDLPNEWGAVSCLMKFYRNGNLFAANRPYKEGYIHYEVLTRCISMGTGSLIIRRTALDDTGYFDENLKRFQDPQIFSCLTEKYKVKLVKKYLHNRDVDDAQNRPSIENINCLQEAFFLSVADQLSRLTKAQNEKMRIIFEFDKLTIYLRAGNKKAAFRSSLLVFKYYDTMRFAFNRVFGKFADRMNVSKRVSKYSKL